MKKVTISLSIVVLLLAFAGMAYAEHMTLSHFNGTEAANSAELNEVWPDSILYWVQNDHYYFASNGWWMGTRFTCPADFELQGIRFHIGNPDENDVDIEIWVYSNDPEGANGGDPDVPLLEDPIWSYTGEMEAGWVEVILEEEDYMQFDEADEFWLIVGESFALDGFWYPTMCANGDPNRTKIGFTDLGGPWTYYANYCQYITAEGEAGAFWDLQVATVHNTLDKFFVTNGQQIQLEARILNGGSETSEEVTANFVVYDDEDNVVLDEDIIVDPLEGYGEVIVGPITGDMDWESGYYMVEVTLVGANMVNDVDDSNDSNMLLQGIVDESDWYKYDDDSFEQGVNYNPEGERGCGIAITPAGYPATLEQGSWNLTADQADCILNAWYLLEDTIYEIWTYEGACVEGWNDFDILDDQEEHVTLEEDGMFILAQINSGFSIVHDTDPPASGANADMHDVSVTMDIGGEEPEMTWSATGNYPMRGYITIPPPATLSITATPWVVPTWVGPNGGSFRWTADIENLSGAPITFDAWTEVILPNGNTYGPVDLYENLEMEAGGSITAAPLQSVPGYAPGGIYDYFAKVGTYPNEIASATFQFAKLPLPDQPMFDNDDHFNDWQLSGWFDEESAEFATSASVPQEYILHQAYPNPFNPATQVSISLPDNADLQLKVINIVGREVAVLADGRFSTGLHNFTFDADGLASGIYFIHAKVPNRMNQLQKVVLMR